MVPPGSSSHYFDADPGARSDRRLVELVLPDLSLRLETDSGVFARDAVDTGTKLLLLDGPEPQPGDRTLVDLGSGYGPIACALAVRNPTATVWAVDVNARARELCDANAHRAGLDNVRVVEPGAFPPDLVVDRLWSNPPIRIGKPALRDLLTRWLGRLGPAGSAHLVVQRHLGADSLHRWLNEAGWRVERRGSKKAFRLLDVTPGGEEPRR
ncbi:MAG: class I SAM-dependent methyltransferase [Acidimicrobiia bacterium]|nr:class I SAM-dependent methyltransferase [Acidimicrobiia bacterium]